MADYISREAAISCFHDWIDRYGHEHSADEMTEYQRIEDLPAADVRPVVRGKWEPAGGSVFPMYACSQCRAISLGGNFCPKCGADMRGRTLDG